MEKGSVCGFMGGEQMGWGLETLRRVTSHHFLPNSILIVLQLEKFSARVSTKRLSLLGKCSRICRKSRMERICSRTFPPPRCSVQSLALDFSHNRLLHFEYVTPQIVGVPAAAVALNLHYTYLPQIRDDGGGIWGIRIRGPGGTTAFQRGCRQPSVI